MGEIMRAIPFQDLVEWSLEEHARRGTVFGLKKEKFYKNESGTSIEMFGDKLSSPVGPAAGPNGQLAQNIIISYLAGARFVELKTIQIIDGADLQAAVARPCINAQDECYNCEWSSEYRVEEARDEYIKAWIAIHVLMKEFGLSDKRDFVFNASVGYDLAGIQSPKVDGFINAMKDASGTDTWKEAIKYLEANLSNFKNFTKADLDAIDSAVAPSVTVSTLHGCPPEEIEKIAMHLITTKNVHTYVKCNPTILGYETARKTLDDMGYGYISFTDHHFKNDLQFVDAVPMLTRLQAVAKEQGLDFGVKITNTFPVLTENHELPSEEMYMSGRSLYPLSVTAANMLTKEFDGKLPISYSGGADHFNIKELLEVGIQPITVATTLLKPGGYGRFHQLAKTAEPELKGAFRGIDVPKMNALVDSAIKNPRHQKSARLTKGMKTDSTLGLFDCYKAPCKDGGCPIHQQIPEYVNLVDAGKLEEAFKIIAIDNALPSITGAICDHNCQRKCTRNDYEESVEIRSKKLTSADAAQIKFIEGMKPATIATDKKAVVIGAGPAGVAVSFFLRRNGMDVTVLEKRDEPLGIVRHIIPEFRIPRDVLKRDYDMAVKSGVNFKFGVNPDYSVEDLKKNYDYVIIATGAWKEGISPVKEGQDNIIDALEFLENSKKNDLNVDLGKRVAVIGAGDVAMDCSRAALKAPGVEESFIIYRRTREFMPAMPEEIDLVLENGVKILELLSPVAYDGKNLTVEVQELTEERDSSGRKLMKGTGKTETMQFDTVIGAVGARVETAPFIANGLAMNDRSMPKVTNSCETNIENVYIAGDCKAGASTVVRAIADAKAVAKHILAKAGLAHDFVKAEVPQPEESIYARKGVLVEAGQPNRCLSCDQICEICTDVCPNRANVSIVIETPQLSDNHQILHIDGMCNECGNCGTFCPHTGNPYLDKFTLFWTEEDFEDSTNRGFLPTGDDTFKVRLENGEVVDYKLGGKNIPAEMIAMINTVLNDYAYYVVKPVH